MAVLTADRNRPVRIPAGGLSTAELKLAGYTNFGGGSTAHTVYKGSVVVCDASDTDGYFRAQPLTSSTAMTTADIFGGIAAEQVKVTSSDTSDGSKKVTVYRNGVWGFPVGSCAITDIGAGAYTSDDGNTVTTDTTNNMQIGIIEDYDATYVWVNIENQFMKPSASTTS